MIKVQNDGPRLVSTNYWDTPHAARGLVYLTLNAGAIRVLLPDAARRGVEGTADDPVEAARTATLAILSRGPDPSRSGRPSLELLFDDGTDTPYSVHLDTQQADRLPLDSDAGREWRLTVWVPGASGTTVQVAELPARYRRVPHLPWLKPWRDTDAKPRG